MDYKELNEKLNEFRAASIQLEEMLYENGGEVTEEVESLADVTGTIKEALLNGGVDMLGQWLCGVESECERIKAERDFLTRQMDNKKRTADFIKSKMYEVLSTAGEDKVRGELGYSFSKQMRKTTSVNKEMLNAMYGDAVAEALKAANLPEDVTITLGASVGRFEGDVLPAYYEQTETPSVRFTKPRRKE